MSRCCFYVRCGYAGQFDTRYAQAGSPALLAQRRPSSFIQMSVAFIATFFLVGLGYGSIPLLSRDATQMISELGPAAIISVGVFLILMSIICSCAKSRVELLVSAAFASGVSAFLFFFTCMISILRNADWGQF